jgi:hypothetical protein
LRCDCESTQGNITLAATLLASGATAGGWACFGSGPKERVTPEIRVKGEAMRFLCGKWCWSLSALNRRSAPPDMKHHRNEVIQ